MPGEVVARVVTARSVVFLTGAGMSSESGIPTFRGQDGLWRRFRPEELATPGAFARDPVLVWEWYDWRRGIIAGARPHAGHDAVAALEELVERVTVITQNVDGLHRRAGSSRVLELHGNIMRVRCADRCSSGGAHDDLPVPLKEIPPRCPCGGLLRPDVVWFGEALSPAVLESAIGELQQADILFVVGTSALVHPAAALAGCAPRGTPVIEVNPEATPVSGTSMHQFRERAGEFLPRLVSAVREAQRAREGKKEDENDSEG
jgi:NAD-dependent deacetylase